MKDKSVKKNASLLNIARILRRNMTRHEKHLWYDFLRYYPIKIYKQRIIDNYVADFYCHSARLVIELDGSGHYSVKGRMYDQERSTVFEKYGILVLRFSNTDIDNHFEDVCRMIDRIITERLKTQI